MASPPPRALERAGAAAFPEDAVSLPTGVGVARISRRSDEPLNEFLTLAGSVEAQSRVRGSRFYALAFPATTVEQCDAIIAEWARARHDATHHCFAWRLREGSYRASDAGEPGGSAGPPILAAIDGADLVDTGIVVTRYFGGTKLGIGGLVRAYGDVARAVLSQAPRLRGVPVSRLTLRYDFARIPDVMRVVARAPVHQVEHGYDPSGARAELHVSVPEPELDAFLARIREETADGADVTLLRRQVIHLTDSA